MWGQGKPDKTMPLKDKSGSNNQNRPEERKMEVRKKKLYSNPGLAQSGTEAEQARGRVN